MSFPHERTRDKCFFYARISVRLRIVSFPHEHTCGIFSTRQYLVCMFQLQSYPVASGPRVKRRIDGRGWFVVRRFLRRVPNCTFLIIAGVLWILMLKSYKKNCYVKVIHTEIIHPAGDVSRALLYYGIPCKSPTKKSVIKRSFMSPTSKEILAHWATSFPHTHISLSCTFFGPF